MSKIPQNVTQRGNVNSVAANGIGIASNCTNDIDDVVPTRERCDFVIATFIISFLNHFFRFLSSEM